MPFGFLALLAAFGALANSLRSDNASALIRTLLRCSARPNGGFEYHTARPLRELRPKGWFAALTSRGLGFPHSSLLTPHSSLLTPPACMEVRPCSKPVPVPTQKRFPRGGPGTSRHTRLCPACCSTDAKCPRAVRFWHIASGELRPMRAASANFRRLPVAECQDGHLPSGKVVILWVLNKFRE